MLCLMRARNLRTAFALSIALSLIVEPIVSSDALAAVGSNPADPAGDQLQDQFNDIVNTPFDFCDLATESAHLMAVITASGKSSQHQLANHHPGPDDVKRAEDKAVQDNKADGGDLVEDLPYVTAYEDAGRRGDVKAQNALFKKMIPAAQAQAAEHDHSYPLAIKLLTPLADAGDLNSQLRLAGIYSQATKLSEKYLPVPDDRVLEVLKRGGMHWPPIEPPENLPLAYKYDRLAATKGNYFGQSELARAYACGFGTEKNLVLAYMWFSLGLAQRGVTTQMRGVSLPINGSQKDYALARDFIMARMKPEEIEKAKQLAAQCYKSGYEDCDLAQTLSRP